MSIQIEYSLKEFLRRITKRKPNEEYECDTFTLRSWVIPYSAVSPDFLKGRENASYKCNKWDYTIFIDFVDNEQVIDVDLYRMIYPENP